METFSSGEDFLYCILHNVWWSSLSIQLCTVNTNTMVGEEQLLQQPDMRLIQMDSDYWNSKTGFQLRSYFHHCVFFIVFIIFVSASIANVGCCPDSWACGWSVWSGRWILHKRPSVTDQRYWSSTLAYELLVPGPNTAWWVWCPGPGWHELLKAHPLAAAGGLCSGINPKPIIWRFNATEL